MAMLRPATLVPITFTYMGAVDNFADKALGTVEFECIIYRLVWRVHDANDTFSDTLLTLEYDDGASGADTVIETIQTGANTVYGTVANENLTQDDIPEGSRILLTVDDVATGADLGVTVTLWVTPVGLF